MGVRHTCALALSRKVAKEFISAFPKVRSWGTLHVKEAGEGKEVLLEFDYVKWYISYKDPDWVAPLEWLEKKEIDLDEPAFYAVSVCHDFPNLDFEEYGEYIDNPWNVYAYRRVGIEFDKE